MRGADLAALVLVVSFGALVNAGGMVGPVVEWQDRLRAVLGRPPLALVIGVEYLIALVLMPIAAVSLAAIASRRWGELSAGTWDVATRYSFALVPLAFALWLAHFGFHLLTSYATIVPTTQRFLGDLGLSFAGRPAWQRACCASVADWIVLLEIVALDVGFLLSLYTAYRLATADARRGSNVESARPVGGAAARLVRRGGVDRAAADGDARHAALGGLNVASRRASQNGFTMIARRKDQE